MNKKPRVGIIGMGHRVEADLYPHLYGKVELKSVCEIKDLCINNLKEKYPGDYDIVDDYKKVTERDDIDWVIVGTPNYLHKEHIISAFENGKNVFSEKPIATTVEDCIAINEAHKKSGKLFATGFTLRYAPHYRKIKNLLEEGIIGDIISFEFNECVPPNHGGHIAKDEWRRYEKLSGGHMLEKCCHDLDLANWMTNSLPIKVASFGGLDFFLPKNKDLPNEYPTRNNGEKLWSSWGALTADTSSPFTIDKDIVDNQVAILQYRSGVRATFHTNINAARPERRFYIVGERGTITADLYHNFIHVNNVSHAYFGGETKDYTIKGDAHMHGGADPQIMKELLDSMQNGTEPKSSGSEGLCSAVVALSIDEARKSNRVIDLTSLWGKLEK